QRDVEDLLAPPVFTPGAPAAAVDLQVLDTGDARQPEHVRHPDAHLIVPGIGRFVPEQQQVERTVRAVRPAACHVRDGLGRGDRPPLAAVGLQQQRTARAERQHVPYLVGRPGRAEGEHGDGATEPFGDLDRLFDRAFLVRADGEAGQPGVHVLPVRGHGDLAADHRHPLDADQDVHAGQLRARWFSGSNSGVAPTTATVTGYRSPRYSTARWAP